VSIENDFVQVAIRVVCECVLSVCRRELVFDYFSSLA